jgi:hypothetical protein
MVVIIQHVAMLKDFRKDEDLVEKTFSVHAEVFQSIAMCLKPKNSPGPTRKLKTRQEAAKPS